MVVEHSLTSEMASAIQVYLDGGRGRSLSGLARRSSVAYSTVRRIYQGTNQVSAHTALAVSEVIMSIPERL